MNRFRNLLLPVVLMAVIGGCYGMLDSFYLSYDGWADMLVSRRTAAAYYPFDVFTGQLGPLLDLVRALQWVATLGLGLWVWNRLGGRELFAALRNGSSRATYRSLLVRALCGTGCFVALSTMLAVSDLHSYGAVESVWTQALGVLCFAPALWALSRQKELLTMIQRSGEEALSPQEARLTTALVSPIVVAPALFYTIPHNDVQSALSHSTRELLESMHCYIPGPWGAAFACGSVAALAGLGAGVLFGALRSSTTLGRRKHQLGGVLLLAAASQVAATQPASAPQLPQIDMTSPASSCTLVALDREVTPQEVRYHRTLTAASSTLSFLARQREVEARARMELFDWNPTAALQTLASNDDAWFAAFGPVMSHLQHSRPADLAGLLPSQLAVIDQGFEFAPHRIGIAPAQGGKAESDLKQRAASSQADLSGVSGTVELDGHPLANTRIRIQAVAAAGDSPAAQMKRKLAGEAWQGPSISTGYGFHQALSGFYASTTTDAQGRFHLDGIENGTYEAVVRFDGVQVVRVCKGGGPITVGARTNVDVGTVELETIHVL